MTKQELAQMILKSLEQTEEQLKSLGLDTEEMPSYQQTKETIRILCEEAMKRDTDQV